MLANTSLLSCLVIFGLLTYSSSVSGLDQCIPLLELKAGIQVSCSYVAANVPLSLSSGVYSLNIAGQITVLGEPSLETGVKLKTIKFDGSATDPALGVVKIAQTLRDSTPLGQIEALRLPPQLNFFVNFNITGERLPNTSGGFELSTLQPAEFVSDGITVVPIGIQRFSLKSPVAVGLQGESAANSAQGIPAFSIHLSSPL
ncbi:hypothetical protein K493DRAFT_371846 [Basidiobolus meristosporus CBS 931.73]|uniref:Late embryogenesis abundant protein LEA-2 subgroup domain-containing protein n=1 Tax=Basidiobolus meristosporus CBS 931.73 TaxID=1314790 RepID=A0A1Y1Z7N5_9FUNG|nr:hypothetical protein K493DRAFT_371846 [Basidiobolus meristosporus CBS 931.73]|eukprot:ORY06308.1 hypothetical protein K493DRAFT_371846 [Basidiobolus meristosporus CBS 931.73]